MSHPVPPPPGPYGAAGQSTGQPSPGPYDGYGQNGQPPQVPAYGSPPAAQSPYGSGQGPGDMAYGQTPPPKKKWPLWVAIGCGCLLLLLILAGGGIFAATQLGGDEEPTGAPTTGEETTTGGETTPGEETTTEEEGGPVSDSDKDAAKDRFLSFIRAIADDDYVTACEHAVSPGTTEPMTGDLARGCAEGLNTASDETKESIKSLSEGLTEEALTMEDNGDGTLAVFIYGQDAEFDMVKADDGTWYIDGGVS